MKNEDLSNIVYLVLIAERKQKEPLIAAILEKGVMMTYAMYGKGTAKVSYLKNTLGLVIEEHKIVITCLLSKEKSSIVLDMLVQEFHFDKPNTGIAFTVPIEKLSF